MGHPGSTGKRRWFYRAWFKRLDSFVDNGLRSLTRSEMAVYLLLMRETRPDGTARASLNDIAKRTGCSKRTAIRAIQSLIDRDVLRVIKPGVTGKATLYTIFPIEVIERMNPTAAKWMTLETGAADGTDRGDTDDTRKGDTDDQNG